MLVSRLDWFRQNGVTVVIVEYEHISAALTRCCGEPSCLICCDLSPCCGKIDDGGIYVCRWLFFIFLLRLGLCRSCVFSLLIEMTQRCLLGVREELDDVCLGE